MLYTHSIHQAISFATKVHAGQVRKGKATPYIVHVLAVGLILARVTTDEDIIIAGILHDTIEDCEPHGSVTQQTLTEMFNQNVAAIVNDVTEPSQEKSEQSKKSTWLERKMAALAHIKDMSHASILVKSADVLQNLTELNQDVQVDGDKTWNRFNANKEDIRTRYERLILEIEKAWSENPLLADLKTQHALLNELSL